MEDDGPGLDMEALLCKVCVFGRVVGLGEYKVSFPCCG